ncbi:MAG: hypothetical protein ACLFWF_10140 [Alphaproteobacteria bacterium]
MTDIAKFWGVLAVFFGAAYIVVGVVSGDGVSLISLVIAWGIIAAGLGLVMLAAIAQSLQRIADLQLSPNNRLVAGLTPRQLMTPRPQRAESSGAGEPEETDPPPHRRPIPPFRRNT